MKQYQKIAFITLATSTLLFAGRDPLRRFESYELETVADSFSYTVGMDMGKQLENLSGYTSIEAIIAGMVDSYRNNEMKLSDEEKETVQQTVIVELQKQQQTAQDSLQAVNTQLGLDFLEENGTRDGVITTESGLQYEIITEGDGEKPTASQTVTVHYVGTTVDGTEFDSSVRRGTPATFPLSNVISGWTEGVQLMSVGSTYKLYIPSELAYGTRGAGQQIGPNSTLIFEIELISIQ